MALTTAKLLGWPHEHLEYAAWCEGWTAMAHYHAAFLIQAAATDGLMPWGDPPDVDDDFRADAKRVFVELRVEEGEPCSR